MNSGITRKDFLRVAVMGTAGLAIIPSLAAAPAETTKLKIIYRIQPVPGKKYSPSFLNFCKRMKFDSAQAAVRRVKDRSHGYLLVAKPV